MSNDYVSKKAVIVMFEEGLNDRQIASELGCRIGQVHAILYNFKDHGRFEKYYADVCDFASKVLNHYPLKKLGNMERVGVTKEHTYNMLYKMCSMVGDFQCVANMFYQHLKKRGASEKDLDAIWEIFKKYTDLEPF